MKKLQLEVSNRYSRLESPEEATHHLYEVLHASGKFPISDGELSVAFVDDATIGQVHDDFMNDPTATDVITFPADLEMASAGEIIVSVDHAQSQAEELGEDFSRELSLYLVHGWLHLAGLDDRNEDDRRKMRAAEQEALALLESAEMLPVYFLRSKV